MKHLNIFIFWYAVLALAVPNVALCFTESLSLKASLANILLPVSVYTALMCISRKPGKMVWWLFPLVFFGAFQIVLLYLFGKGVIAVDMFLNLVTTNPGEAMELLDNLIPGVASVFILYLPLLIISIVSIRSRKAPVVEWSTRRRYLRCAVIGFTAGAVATAWAYCGDTTAEKDGTEGYTALNEMYPVNVCYNLYLAVKRNNASNNYGETSAEFTFRAKSDHPEGEREVYVMVIGETARAANFGIYGYRRQTTPLLAKTRGLVAFDNVTTQSNTTHKSVPMLLSAVSATDFESLYSQKGIMQAFREAGFHTVFLSNQMPNHSFIDFLGEQADQWAFLKTGDCNKEGKLLQLPPRGSDGNIYDAALLGVLDQVLKQGHRKEFVVLHTYGSHFNYQERYPREMAFYKPDTHCEAKMENRTDLINAYDNTIRYTDTVLHGVIERLEKCGGMTAMLYTSDHGENIFDDSHKLFLHASPRASLYELHVPFIVWTSPEYSLKETEVCRNLLANRQKTAQSSASAFHTMLSIGGVSTPLRRDDQSLASGKYRPAPLLYLNDHNKAIPQKYCGF